MAMVFNLVNASANGYWLFWAGPERPLSWLADPRFLVGVLLFLGGMAVNLSSDYRLLGLRRSGGARYQNPPARGLFRWVSCPNYLGEIVEWCGWALATWSLAGLSFAAWTVANLVPRALAHHRWYRATFPEYPAARKALIPFLL
jgi:steroid 5-alpha reductase family enzyme